MTTAPLRHLCGTFAAPLRHLCGTFAAPLRHLCGTFAAMLPGFTSFSLTTTEAWAQAGLAVDGGAGRAVVLSAESTTEGITITGPIEEGFEPGESAFIVEFNPTKLDDQPPPHASVTIKIEAADGWTLNTPDQGAISVTRDVERGTFAADTPWQATRFVNGKAEDEAAGSVRAAWPWAEFEVEFDEPETEPGKHVHDVQRPAFFVITSAIRFSAEVSIRITPKELPIALKNSEAQQWRSGWIQNVTDVNRRAVYPLAHVIHELAFDAEEKADFPVFDSLAKKGEVAINLWYNNAIPNSFGHDNASAEPTLVDRPTQTFTYVDPRPEHNGIANLVSRAWTKDSYRTYLVAARGQGDNVYVEFLRACSWATNIELAISHNQTTDAIDVETVHNAVTYDEAQHGAGLPPPDLTPPNANQLREERIDVNPNDNEEN